MRVAVRRRSPEPFAEGAGEGIAEASAGVWAALRGWRLGDAGVRAGL